MDQEIIKEIYQDLSYEKIHEMSFYELIELSFMYFATKKTRED